MATLRFNFRGAGASAGQQISAHNYYPFGAEITWTDAVAETMTFTGHEREGEPSSGWTPLYGETSPTLRVSPAETEYYRVSVAAADGTVVASHTAAVRIK